MKTLGLAFVCVLMTVSSGLAASVTVANDSAALPGVAASTAAILLDAGLPVKHAGGAKRSIEAKNFHCDVRNNGALDPSNVHSNLPTVKCRINSKNQQGSKAGKVFGDARALSDLLGKIQDSSASGGTTFSDCGMGYCGTFAKSIKCTIDTSVQDVNSGARLSCTYVDGQ